MWSNRVLWLGTIATTLAAGASLVTPRTAAAEIRLVRDESTTPVSLPRGKLGFSVKDGAPLVLSVSGPGTVEVQAMRALAPRKASRRAAPAVLTVSVDGARAMTSTIPARPAGTRRRNELGKPKSLAFDIGAGVHAVTFAVAGRDQGVVLVFSAPVEVAGTPATVAAAIPSAAATPPPPTSPETGVPTGAVASPADGGAAEQPLIATLASAPVAAVPEPDAGAAPAGSEVTAPGAPATDLLDRATGPASSLVPAEQAGDYPVRLGLRLGGYHPSGGSDLGGALAAGLEVRVGLPVLPGSLGRLSAAVSASWLSFTHEETLEDPALGSFETRYTLRFVPATLEAVYELPRLGPVQLYGGAGVAVLTALSESEAFAHADERVSVRPGLQAFGAVGMPLGPVLLGLELRYSNVNLDFDTGTVGSGAGLFGQAVVSFRVL